MKKERKKFTFYYWFWGPLLLIGDVLIDMALGRKWGAIDTFSIITVILLIITNAVAQCIRNNRENQLKCR